MSDDMIATNQTHHDLHVGSMLTTMKHDDHDEHAEHVEQCEHGDQQATSHANGMPTKRHRVC